MVVRHFIYQHLPASGLGRRPSLRSYITGGIGRAIRVIIRWFGAVSSAETSDRSAVSSSSDLATVGQAAERSSSSDTSGAVTMSSGVDLGSAGEGSDSDTTSSGMDYDEGSSQHTDTEHHGIN